MDKSESHLTQWRHNRKFIEEIPRDYPDWMATATFYAALQMVDALLAKQKIRTISHDHRNEVLRSTHQYSRIWKLYQPLYNLSRTVRYLADPKDWIPIERMESDVFPRLYGIEVSALKLIKSDEKPPGIKIRPMAAG